MNITPMNVNIYWLFRYISYKNLTSEFYALQAEGHRFEPGSSHPEGLT